MFRLEARLEFATYYRLQVLIDCSKHSDQRQISNHLQPRQEEMIHQQSWCCSDPRIHRDQALASTELNAVSHRRWTSIRNENFLQLYGRLNVVSSQSERIWRWVSTFIIVTVIFDWKANISIFGEYKSGQNILKLERFRYNKERFLGSIPGLVVLGLGQLEDCGLKGNRV